ncbi:MAG: hypothetical protein U0Y68_13740 [Blastocatellia bacterium]
MLSANEQKSLQKAFDYLAPKLAEFDEPYAIALYTLAAQQFGDKHAPSVGHDATAGARKKKTAAHIGRSKPIRLLRLGIGGTH